MNQVKAQTMANMEFITGFMGNATTLNGCINQLKTGGVPHLVPSGNLNVCELENGPFGRMIYLVDMVMFHSNLFKDRVSIA